MTSLEKQVHRAPADQLRSVHEVAKRLFPAYIVDGGSVHLAGCRLEERLFLKLEDAGQARSSVLYMDESGRAIEESFARSLGMDETVPWNPPPEMPPVELGEMVQRSMACARERWGVEGELHAQFIWCKYAEGKLRFTIGDRSVDLPFSGWTKTLEASPFICPYSGASSFHIAATDNGRIAAAESIQTCAETGRRMLASDLVTCEATGLTVSADLTRVCPVTQQHVLERELATCSMCRERVSPTVIEDGRCLACRSTRPIAKTSPPLAGLLSNNGGLNRWSKWAASETAEVHILLATGWWKRLVVVVGKADSQVRHAALARRFGGEFLPIEVGEIDSLR